MKATEEIDLWLPCEVHSLSELVDQIVSVFFILYDSIYINFENRQNYVNGIRNQEIGYSQKH